MFRHESSTVCMLKAKRINALDAFLLQIANKYLTDAADGPTIRSGALPTLTDAFVHQYDSMATRQYVSVEDFIKKHSAQIERSGVVKDEHVPEQARLVVEATQAYVNSLRGIGGPDAHIAMEKLGVTAPIKEELLAKDHWKREAFRQAEINQVLSFIIVGYQGGGKGRTPDSYEMCLDFWLWREGIPKIRPVAEQDAEVVEDMADEFANTDLGGRERAPNDAREVGQTVSEETDSRQESGVAVDLGEGEWVDEDESRR